jgi:hypothetical protein
MHHWKTSQLFQCNRRSYLEEKGNGFLTTMDMGGMKDMTQYIKMMMPMI